MGRDDEALQFGLIQAPLASQSTRHIRITIGTSKHAIGQAHPQDGAAAVASGDGQGLPSSEIRFSSPSGQSWRIVRAIAHWMGDDGR